jgi:ketosteroid isomerase-like protein
VDASGGAGDVFEAARGGGALDDFFHPDAQHALFGPTGRKEVLQGRDAFLAFVERCSSALADRSDEILAITGIDAQCAFVHACAYRKSAATGEAINYEWAMLYRVEEGRITYGADMLDRDAQAFWGRISPPSA